MNRDWMGILAMLNVIKFGAGCSQVAFELAPWGMKISVDWDDNSHCRYALGSEQINSANYDIAGFMVDYFNMQHAKLLENPE